MGDQGQEQENVVAPPVTMGAHNKVTIGTYRPALVLSDAARKLEIKGHFIQQLPKFYGMPNEDVLSFMREIGNFVMTLTVPDGTKDEDIQMRIIPMCLQDNAKAWLTSLPGGSLTTWEDFCDAFTEKYYPQSKTAAVKAQITRFQQKYDETFYEAWERFKKLLAQCPHHRIALPDLNQHFYDGLNYECQFLIDMSCGGGFMDMTAEALRDKIEMLAKGSQRRSPRNRTIMQQEAKSADEYSDSSIGEMILQEMQQTRIAAGNPQSTEVCGKIGRAHV